MKEKSIGKNAFLNMIRQGLSVVFPLIAYPYAVRTLGPDSLGKVNFVQSIIGYFSLLAMLGVSNYIIREGSRIRDDKPQLIKLTNEVYTINVIFTAIAYLLLIILTMGVSRLREYRLLIFVQSLSIALTTFGVDWINTIYEDFLKITIRSIVTYLITLVLLFVFVKDESDYYLYSLLTVITNAIICLSNRLTCTKYLKLKITKRMNIKTHIFPLLILFVNSLALSINTSFDTTMLGWIKGDFDVGMYALPAKIYTVIKNIVFAIYAVALPRLSFYAGKDDRHNYKVLNSKIWSYLVLFTFPASIGLVLTSKYIVEIMGGSILIESNYALRLLSLALPFVAISGVIMNAMNISLKREKENLIATILCAFANVLLNIFFIPRYSYNGAAFTTLLSEILLVVVCFIRFPNITEYVDIKSLGKVIIHSIIGCVSIVFSYFFITKIGIGFITSFILIVIVGVISYIGVMLLLKEKLILNILYSCVRRLK